MQSSAGLRIVPPLPEAQKSALECRSLQEAIDAPTVAQLMRVTGSMSFTLVSAAAGAIVHKGMEAFSPQRRLTPEVSVLFGERFVELYPHESLADLALFMRGVVVGKYGDGETYGALDMQRMFVWFREYLAEKAAAMERGEHALQQEQDQHARKVIAAVPGLQDAVKSFVISEKERSDIVRKEKRVAGLKRQLPTMSDDALRNAWKIYRDLDERALIQAQASRKGLMGPELQAAQLQLDEEARVAAATIATENDPAQLEISGGIDQSA